MLRNKNLPLDDYNPMCVDIAPFLSRPYTEKRTGKGEKGEAKEYGPQLEVVVGCRDGQVLIFDPWITNAGRVIKYNSDIESSARKKKKVTHVKWFEPLTEGENCNKFMTVFEDGTIFVSFRDSEHKSENRSVKLLTSDYSSTAEPKEFTRDQALSLM